MQLCFQNMEVDEIVIHEKFAPRTLINNIALLFLSKDAPITEHINIVCLPSQNQKPKTNVGCLTAGWGQREMGNPEILKYSDLPILHRDNCTTALRKGRLGPYYNLDKSFICTGKRAGHGQCIGDRGAPLFCRQTDEEFVQFGIVSFNIECKWPTVYTDVSLFKDWITEKMNNKNLVLVEDEEEEDLTSKFTPRRHRG